MWPSAVPEKTTPGIKVAAADCALVQRCAPQPHLGAGAGVCHILSPVAIFTAERPGLRVSAAPNGSATGTYTVVASAVNPHSMPPSAVPPPSLFSQSFL